MCRSVNCTKYAQQWLVCNESVSVQRRATTRIARKCPTLVKFTIDPLSRRLPFSGHEEDSTGATQPPIGNASTVVDRQRPKQPSAREGERQRRHVPHGTAAPSHGHAGPSDVSRQLAQTGASVRREVQSGERAGVTQVPHDRQNQLGVEPAESGVDAGLDERRWPLDDDGRPFLQKVQLLVHDHRLFLLSDERHQRENARRGGEDDEEAEEHGTTGGRGGSERVRRLSKGTTETEGGEAVTAGQESAERCRGLWRGAGEAQEAAQRGQDARADQRDVLQGDDGHVRAEEGATRGEEEGQARKKAALCSGLGHRSSGRGDREEVQPQEQETGTTTAGLSGPRGGAVAQVQAPATGVDDQRSGSGE